MTNRKVTAPRRRPEDQTGFLSTASTPSAVDALVASALESQQEYTSFTPVTGQ